MTKPSMPHFVPVCAAYLLHTATVTEILKPWEHNVTVSEKPCYFSWQREDETKKEIHWCIQSLSPTGRIGWACVLICRIEKIQSPPWKQHGTTLLLGKIPWGTIQEPLAPPELGWKPLCSYTLHTNTDRTGFLTSFIPGFLQQTLRPLDP